MLKVNKMFRILILTAVVFGFSFGNYLYAGGNDQENLLSILEDTYAITNKIDDTFKIVVKGTKEITDMLIPEPDSEVNAELSTLLMKIDKTKVIVLTQPERDRLYEICIDLNKSMKSWTKLTEQMSQLKNKTDDDTVRVVIDSNLTDYNIKKNELNDLKDKIIEIIGWLIEDKPNKLPKFSSKQLAILSYILDIQG